MKRRFRLLDWKTRWFWLLIFYRKEYGEPAWQIETFRPSAADRRRGVWIERPNKWGWGWEDEPDTSGQLEASIPTLERWSNDGVRETCTLGHQL